MLTWNTAFNAITWACLLAAVASALAIAAGRTRRGAVLPFRPMLLGSVWLAVLSGLSSAAALG